MSEVHIIRSASGNDYDALALCGGAWEEGVIIGSSRDIEATCKECREFAGIDKPEDDTDRGELEDMEPVPCNTRIRYRYTITVTGDDLLSFKQREYLESKIEAATGFEVNVRPKPEEIEEEVDDE